MEWLALPLIFLAGGIAIGILFHGWPTFIEINHYHVGTGSEAPADAGEEE